MPKTKLDPSNTLTDIPDTEEETKAKEINRTTFKQLAFQSLEEAEQGARDALVLLEKLHNWAQANNRLNVIGIDPVYRKQPSANKAVDKEGKVLMEEPHVNIHMRFPLLPEAISLPLSQGIYLAQE